jgi:dihydrofolate synthase/folylpolyglutamate synthase
MLDKDVNAMAAEIGPRVDTVVATRAPGTDRAAPAEALAADFAGRVRQVIALDDAADGLRRALGVLGPDDVLVVAGSLYLVGWARTQLATSGAGI